MTISVYTDGSCHNKKGEPSSGAWAYLVVDATTQKLIYFDSGFCVEATSQTMEMFAVQEALKALGEAYDVKEIRIHSDSAYVVNCFLNCWYKKWELLNYISVKNEKYWRELISIVRQIRKDGKAITFIKVKGHSGNLFNELVDKIAGEERQNGIYKTERETYKQQAIELLESQ